MNRAVVALRKATRCAVEGDLTQNQLTVHDGKSLEIPYKINYDRYPWASDVAEEIARKLK